MGLRPLEIFLLVQRGDQSVTLHSVFTNKRSEQIRIYDTDPHSTESPTLPYTL